jgi:hypothetical protein
MSNAKAQMSKLKALALIMINPERVELQNFEIWHSFGICLPARSRFGEGRDFDIWNSRNGCSVVN